METHGQLPLLRVTQAIVAELPLELIRELLAQPAKASAESLPDESPDSEELIQVQQLLARAAIHEFARQGATSETSLRGDELVTGPVWERVSPEQRQLTFSVASWRWLQTLAEHGMPFLEAPTERKPAAILGAFQTVGDAWLIWRTYQRLVTLEQGADVSHWPVFCDHPWVRLAYPHLFETIPHTPIDWARWLAEGSVWWFEGLQRELTEAVVATELAKLQLRRPRRLAAISTIQSATYASLLTALAEAQRMDLALFLLPAVGKLLDASGESSATVEGWFRNVDWTGLRLADKQAVVHDASVLFRTVSELLAEAQLAARDAHFLDEDYSNQLLYRTRWEQLRGNDRVTQARSWLTAQATLV